MSDQLRFEIHANLLAPLHSLNRKVADMLFVSEVAERMDFEHCELEYEGDNIRRYAVFFDDEDQAGKFADTLSERRFWTGLFRYFDGSQKEAVDRIVESHPAFGVASALGEERRRL
jgi:hypothetical protein